MMKISMYVKFMLALTAIMLIGGLWLKEHNRRKALACLVKVGSIMDSWKSPFNGATVDRLTDLEEMYEHIFYTPEAIATGEGNGVTQEEVGNAIKTLQPKALMFYTRNALSPVFLQDLKETNSIEILDFDGSFTFDDKSLGYLAGMPNLIELAIEDSGITNKSLHLISTFPSLKILGIGGTNLTEDDKSLIMEKNNKILFSP